MDLAKKILVDRYYHANSRSKANDIVREFVIDKQLIITGGLVVDFALRLKGKHIYEDYEVPDYDFFSKNNAEDACELFELLMKSGFDNISLLPGIHPSTIKIFVFKDCVADITYASEKWFSEMKNTALMYNGMLFRDPLIQYVDMHRSLSFPYENEPRETINFRWEKDFQRFVMLYSLYPSNIEHSGVSQCDAHQLLRKYVICGMFAIKYYLESAEPNSEHVYLMNKADYAKFTAVNSNRMRNIKKYKAYQELLPERTEFELSGDKFTVLHCQNKVGIYYINDQEIMQRSAIEKAKMQYLRVAKSDSSNAKSDFSIAKIDNIDINDDTQYKICSINFCIIYCFAMYRITGKAEYNYYYSRLLKLVYDSYVDGNIKYYPSIITYGEELEKPIITHTNANPEFKVPQVHISNDDTDEVRDAQLAKLPWKFIPPKEVYDLDGQTLS